MEDPDSRLDEPIELHGIGGFAIVAAYGWKRSTNDLDYFTLIPCNCVPDLEKLAGEGSPLAKKYKVHVHHAGLHHVGADDIKRDPTVTNTRI